MNQYDNNSKKNIDRTLILAKTLMKTEDLEHLQKEWENNKNIFLPLPLTIAGVSKIIESFKSDIIQQRDGEACRVLAERYKTGYSKVIGSYIKKDEYTANLLTLIGKNLGNENCIKIFNLSPTKYKILESTANNFICNYIGRSDITFDDAILSSACSDTLNIVKPRSKCYVQKSLKS